MDDILWTPRLKCTLLTKAERGSPTFEWLHAIHSDPQATAWSIHGTAKEVEDTERVIKGYLPNDEGAEKNYRVAYAVHEVLANQKSPTDQAPTNFIGVITVRSLGPSNLALSEELTLPAETATTTLQVEVAYFFLPHGWGKGFATESVTAVLEACKKNKSFWQPFPKLYVRAIVNGTNPPSHRVMEKIGMKRRGIHYWKGKPIFLGGRWREEDELIIYGTHLFE